MKNLNEMSDEELALSYVAGNNQAFDLLLARNQTKIFSYILFLVCDRFVADDIFQETFVRVIQRLHEGKYVSNGRFEPWCIRIAHNLIMDWYRRQRAQKIVEPTEDNDLTKLRCGDVVSKSVEHEMVHRQVLDDVRKMVRLLPPSQREVVFMRYYQHLSFKEIAEITNVCISTSLGRMRYALLNLRKMAREHHIFLQLD